MPSQRKESGLGLAALQAGCRWFEPGTGHGGSGFNNRRNALPDGLFRVESVITGAGARPEFQSNLHPRLHAGFLTRLPHLPGGTALSRRPGSEVCDATGVGDIRSWVEIRMGRAHTHESRIVVNSSLWAHDLNLLRTLRKPWKTARLHWLARSIPSGRRGSAPTLVGFPGLL